MTLHMYITLIALIVVAAITGWTICGTLTHALWNRVFNAGPENSGRSVAVLAGPLGTIAVVLCVLVRHFLALCDNLGARLDMAMERLIKWR